MGLSFMAVDPVQLILAMGLSFILIAAIIACANFISYFGRERKKERASTKSLSYEDFIVPLQHFILLRVLLDKKEHASLSAFQFLCWTLLISFLYITLWFLQLLNGGMGAPPPIPESVLALMGISVAIPLASQGISSYKNRKPRGKGETFVGPDYASMLEEEGKPSLLRFQMFLWTLASLVLYTGLFFVSVNNAADIPALVNLGLPTIDTTLLFLMGLSAAGYLGNQVYSGKVEKAEEPAQPPTGSPGPTPASSSPFIKEMIVDTNGLVTLLGSGFGTKKETIIIDENRVPDDAIMRWEGMRIDFAMPETVSRGTRHSLRVVVGGETASGQIPGSGTMGTARSREIDATIIGDLWIDSPNERGYKIPPIGYFIPEKRYFFCFEFDVPLGTPQWGGPQFRAQFFIDGTLIDTHSFLPGASNGKNYGNFYYVFPDEGKHHIEIKGANTKSLDIEVKRPMASNRGGV
jgi:hypothetical protein